MGHARSFTTYRVSTGKVESILGTDIQSSFDYDQ